MLFLSKTIAGLALIGFVSALSAVLKERKENKEKFSKNIFADISSFLSSLDLASLCCALTFLYIPIGSLPSVLGTRGDMILIVTLIAISDILPFWPALTSKTNCAQPPSDVLNSAALWLPLSAAVFTVAWFALRNGMPGAPFSLDTFAATPIWQISGPLGTGGFACFLLTLVPLIKKAHTLKALALASIVTVIFCPWGVSYFVPDIFGGNIIALFTIDFIFFWIKALLLLYAAKKLPTLWESAISNLGFCFGGIILITLDVLGMSHGI